MASNLAEIRRLTFTQYAIMCTFFAVQTICWAFFVVKQRVLVILASAFDFVATLI